MKTLNILSLAVLAVLTGCGGDDGKNGVSGTNGVNGSNGLNSLINQTMLAAGHEQCLNGGIQVDSGIDDDHSGSIAIRNSLDLR